MRAALSGAVLALMLAQPATAGEALDRAIVATASLPICDTRFFTEAEAAGLTAIASTVEGKTWVETFAFVAGASDFLFHETRKRGTARAFCQQVRRLAATMPRT